jgi:DNA-directed RNA polymerase beta' subunit
MVDSNLFLLGLSETYARPEWMILTVLPVPPPPVRPSIAVDGGAMRSEDDLTYKLGDIKASVNVRRCETEGALAHVITEFEQLLQVRSTMFTHFCEAVLISCSSSTLRHTWTTTLQVSLKHCRSLDGP